MRHELSAGDTLCFLWSVCVRPSGGFVFVLKCSISVCLVRIPIRVDIPDMPVTLRNRG